MELLSQKKLRLLEELSQRKLFFLGTRSRRRSLVKKLCQCLEKSNLNNLLKRKKSHKNTISIKMIICEFNL